MTIIPDKYRGTPEFDQVRSVLIAAAKARELVEYSPGITQIMGLDEPSGHMARELGLMLGEISEDEHLASRPMLSAVGINTQGRPGQGFFDLARELGKPVRDEDEFWSRELQAFYDEWSE